MSPDWSWKNKDGTSPGLLYESGNWGDLLKLLWVKAVIDWKGRNGREPVDYFDPFAGDVFYPFTSKARYRIGQIGGDGFAFLEEQFLGHDLWPSAAAAACLCAGGRVDVFDADAGRRDNWSAMSAEWPPLSGAAVLEGDSGWELLRGREPAPNAVWLVDPYDFLAEWRDFLPLVLEKARAVTLLLYLYNRSAKGDAQFRNYRDFKNALADGRSPRPKRLGRVAADVFLPNSHHEMLFLPSDADLSRDDVGDVLRALAGRADELSRGFARVAACEA